jgi:acetamidase/formamidase
MPALVAGIHVFGAAKYVVDRRVRSGDGERSSTSIPLKTREKRQEKISYPRL